MPAKSFAGIVVDDAKAKLTGEWGKREHGPCIDEGYRHDGNEEKGEKSARFEAKLPKAGRYEVRLALLAQPEPGDERAGDGGVRRTGRRR